MRLLVQCPSCKRFHRIELDNRKKTPSTEESTCFYCKRHIPIQPRQEEK